MDVVRAFNNELSSLYEVKPPISKAKMTQITKSAIKGIKFYKHIVQSVEKFIQKCRPEYKVPGLYVVDSIVRQSRHQFGSDKDVFGPRFMKNIGITFQHLYKCAEEDRPKIVRVLNLWQKNAVFPSDMIQPLMDMANPNSTVEWPLDIPHAVDNDSPVQKSFSNDGNSKHKSEHSPWKGWSHGNDEPPESRPYAEMSRQNLEKFTKGEGIDEDSSQHRIQMLSKPIEENAVKFNKKLLDFDYGDEEDEEEVKHDDSHLSNEPNALALSMAQNLLSNPELLRQLTQMQQTIQQNEALKSELSLQHPKPDENDMSYSSDTRNSPPSLNSACLESRLASFQQQFLGQEGGNDIDKDAGLLPHPVATHDFDGRSCPASRSVPPHPYTDTANLMQFQYDNNAIPFPPQPQVLQHSDSMPLETTFPTGDQLMIPSNNQIDEDERMMYSMPGEPPLPPQDFDERSLMLAAEERARRSGSGSPSRSRGRSGRHRSRSKSPRRHRSRSRENARRNRSRSRERKRLREKEKERELERERDRRRKGLPPIKKGHVSVCSTTLWLGHVPKSSSEADISSMLGTYGTILSIDMIPPRGCAYVVMDRRQDGYRILSKVKNVKLQGSNIKMAWAPGKGVKGKEFKDYWEVDAGVSYVPFEKIRNDTAVLDLLEEGGFIDEETLPDPLRVMRQENNGDKNPFLIEPMKDKNMFDGPSGYDMNPSAMVAPPMMPTTSVSLPMVLPHMMQPQFGIHLPGMMPPQMVMPVPMGIPPPNQMMMMQQQPQGMLAGTPLPQMSQMMPRSIPPMPQQMQNMKAAQSSESSTDSPVVSATPVAGDATPTDEDGTSVSSPSTIPTPTSGAMVMAPFSQMNFPNAGRNMPPVPSSGANAPIPFPPPNVGYGFPPPGIRPQGHGMRMPNPQFPWMQKPAEQDASTRSMLAQSPHHKFGSRPPFPARDNQPSTKDDPKQPPNDDESLHHDKMHQEMVISTDDDESMDQEYSRNEGPPPRFQGGEFQPRGPPGMQWMRGPPPGAMMGPRFPRGMHSGSRFPMRMGGPHGMMGPGMHPRMEMDFPPHPDEMEMEFGRHPDNRGHRMMMGGPPPRRGDMRGGPDWYPDERDFDGPPFEMEHFHPDDDWGHPRDGWVTNQCLERNEPPRRPPRDRGPDWNGPPPPDEWQRENEDRREREPRPAEFKPKVNKPPAKPKGKQDLSGDMFRLRFYARDKNARPPMMNKRPERTMNQKEPRPEPSRAGEPMDKPTPDADIPHDAPAVGSEKSDQNIGNEKRDKDRKKSRWGRTLSEEREFQQQKRNEIEMKFQSYEMSHSTQKTVLEDVPESIADNGVDMPAQRADFAEGQDNVADLPMPAQHADFAEGQDNVADLPMPAQQTSFGEEQENVVGGDLGMQAELPSFGGELENPIESNFNLPPQKFEEEQENFVDSSLQMEAAETPFAEEPGSIDDFIPEIPSSDPNFGLPFEDVVPMPEIVQNIQLPNDVDEAVPFYNENGSFTEPEATISETVCDAEATKQTVEPESSTTVSTES